MQKVFDSMRDQTHDQFVIVLDATDPGLADWCRTYWKADPRTVFVQVDRPKGWRSPVKAWNLGYKAVRGDLLYCFSSETVQADGNITRAGKILAEHSGVLFGKAICSCGPDGHEVNWSWQAPGNLLCSSAFPRPLGFIWAAPMPQVRSIGGWDEAFDAGFWYDENDFFFRLWGTGLDFIFDDSVSGIHLHHERPVLETPAGQAGIQRNAAYMMAKHGSLNPMPEKVDDAVAWHDSDTRKTWRHTGHLTKI